MATSVALPLAAASSTKPKPNWNDLREAFVTVKRDYLMKQTMENVTLKEVNQSIKMQNSHLSGQIDKLKRLCHLCLNLIMTSQQQPQQKEPSPSSSSSTSAAMKTVKSDNTLQATAAAAAANDQSPSPDSPMEDEIELLILEYLYSGSASADGSSNCADSTTQLVKHFEELASRLSAVTAGAKSTVGDSAKLTKLTVQQQKQQSLLSPCDQKKRKRSLIKRILSGFHPHHHQNEPETSRNGSRKASTGSGAHSPTTPNFPTPSVLISSPICTHLANSAATAAGHHQHKQSSHLRSSNSLQKLHEFFEFQQENQRILPKACSAQEAADEADNEEANQLTVTNNYHLQVAHIKAMNGGVGSPTKSVSATEEHSGAQLSTHIDVNGIVDTAPKMSEVAMFCGLKENNVANPLLNVAKQKEAEKRHQQEEEKAKANKAKKKGQEEEDEQGNKNGVSVMDSSFFVSLYTLQQQQQQQQLQSTRPIFEIGLDDEEVARKEAVPEDEGLSSESSPPDSVVDCSFDADSLPDEMDMEQEMDRLLEHIHQHQWFVLPTEAAALTASDIVNQLNTEVIDLNNVEAAFQAIHRLWLARKHSTSRLLFFYQMFSYLFDKYLNVIHCDCHHPPCAPSVEATLFGKLAVQIVRRLLECINRSRHLVIQIELLSSIESLVYNRPALRPALPDIFHHLFTAGLIEATAFVEWAKLDDPSAQFEAAQPKQSTTAGGGRPLKGPLAEQTQKSSSKEAKTKLKASLSMPPKLSTMTTTSAAPSAQQPDMKLTNRERLFQELKKAGFAIFKCKF